MMQRLGMRVRYREDSWGNLLSCRTERRGEVVILEMLSRYRGGERGKVQRLGTAEVFKLSVKRKEERDRM